MIRSDLFQGLSPSCVDLQDIASDDEDDGAAGYIDDKDSSDGKSPQPIITLDYSPSIIQTRPIELRISGVV